MMNATAAFASWKNVLALSAVVGGVIVGAALIVALRCSRRGAAPDENASSVTGDSEPRLEPDPIGDVGLQDSLRGASYRGIVTEDDAHGFTNNMSELSSFE
jgi:hypothetical protein